MCTANVYIYKLSVMEKVLANGIPSVYHPKCGEPLCGILSADENGIFWKNNTSICFWQVRSMRLDYKNMETVLPGRQTSNFLRTRKYVKEILLPDLDAKSFSIMGSEKKWSFDMELGDEQLARDLVAFIDGKLNRQVEDRQILVNVEYPQGFAMRCHDFSQHPWFSKFILVCILVNTISMALQSPTENNVQLLSFLKSLDYVMLIIFTIESVIKCIGMEGLLPFLKDRWDLTDFVIILASWVSEVPYFKAINVSAFRAFRAVRTLKYFNGIQEILETFTGTMVMVGYALLCYCYFLIVFAIFGTYAFGDALEHRCALLSNTGEYLFMQPTTFCSPMDSENSCGNSSSAFSCQSFGNPNHGNTGFTSFIISFATLFRISSRAGLRLPLIGTMQTRSSFSLFFFIAVIVCLSFMILTLFVAIVRSSFSVMKEQRKNELQALQKKLSAYKERRRSTIRFASKKLFSINIPDALHAAKYNSLSKIKSMPKKYDKVMMMFPKKGKLVRNAEQLVKNHKFELFISGCIVANTFFLALEYHGMPPWHRQMLSIAEVVFTIVFTVEMFLKIIGLGGLVNYLFKSDGSKWNQFDCFIVVGGGVDFFLSSSGLTTGGSSISLLRAVRLLRIVRILRNNPELLKVLQAIISSLSAMLNLLFFTLLVSIVYAILGMQLYGGVMVEDPVSGIPPRANFDTFLQSLLTLFRMFSGGGTWEIFYNALNTSTGGTAPLFFLSFSVFAVYVTLNFMIVILLSSFVPTDEEIDHCRESQQQFHLGSVLAKPDHILHRINPQCIVDKELVHNLHAQRRSSIIVSTPEIQKLRDVNKRWKTLSTLCHRTMPSKFLSTRQYQASLFLFPRYTAIRRAATYVLQKSEGFILFCIFVSSVCLAIENPKSNVEVKQVIQHLNVYLLIVFWVEFVVKVVSMGFVLGSRSYLHDSWNRLDFSVLFFSTMGLISPSTGLGSYFRVGRILRPLRVVGRHDGMKIIIRAILKSAGEVMYSISLLICLFFMFGVLGISLFSGKFAYCNDVSVAGHLECHGHFMKNGVLYPRVWQNPYHHFDHIGAAVVSLFEIVTGKGWLEVMNSGMDTTGIDTQPQRNSSSANAMYFMLFIFIGTFYMLKLFVGIVVGNFRRFTGTALDTPTQSIWVAMQAIIAKIHPEPPAPEGMWNRRLYNLVNNKLFHDFITFAIWCHMLMLAIQCPNTIAVHWICCVIYAAEFIAKVGSNGIYVWSRNPWNISELFVLLAMVVFVPVGFKNFALVAGLVRAIEFRRIEHTLSRLPGLGLLFDTLLSSLPVVANVSLLFSLIIFIYAILGMQLFSAVRWNAGLTSNSYFFTFTDAILTLYQFAGGENWTIILRACRLGTPWCTTKLDGRSDCGSSIAGVLYFYSFYIFVFLVFLNLYVAAVLDTYVAVSRRKLLSNQFTFTVSDLKVFQTAWTEYDRSCQGFILVARLPEFFKFIGEPLGFKPSDQAFNDKLLADARIYFGATTSISNIIVGPSYWRRIVHFVQTKSLYSKVYKHPFDTSGLRCRVYFHNLLLFLARYRVPLEFLSIEERVQKMLRESEVNGTKAQQLIINFLRRAKNKRLPPS